MNSPAARSQVRFSRRSPMIAPCSPKNEYFCEVSSVESTCLWNVVGAGYTNSPVLMSASVRASGAGFSAILITTVVSGSQLGENRFVVLILPPRLWYLNPKGAIDRCATNPRDR